MKTIEIHASATYNKETLKKFALADIKKMKKINIAIVSTLSAIFVLNFITKSIIPVIAIPIFLAVYFLYLYVLIPHIVYKQSKSTSDIVNTYVFTDTKFTTSSSSIGFSGTSDIEYTNLYKAIETTDFLYLYISRSQAIIVDKSTIAKSEAETLKQTIMSALKEKYKII